MIKKTIIYTGGFELPDKNAAAQRVLANAKIFRDLGFNVVLVGIDKTLPLSTDIAGTKSSVQWFETWSVPYPSSKKSWFSYITTAKPLAHLISNFYSKDLYAVIPYNYPAIAQLQIKQICKQHKALFIPDATEWYESSGGSILFNTIKWIDTTLRMRYVHPKADGIITTSRYLTDFYQKKGCATVELPTLYDVERFDQFKYSEKDDTDIVKILYAGSAFNLSRVDKNRSNIKDRLDKIILMLDKVYETKQNFILNIYGLTRENYLAVFPEHTEILKKLSKNVSFHGRKPHSEIIQAIQESDFTIFMRNIERVIEAGFPSKFSESISYGTPVISNMISNIEKYAVESKNHIALDLNDIEKQIKTMLSILNLLTSEREIMKQYCRKHKIFDYRNFITPVKKFLYSLETK